MHRVLRILSTALITAGLVVLADVGLTLAWKEPLSSIYGALQQDEASDELSELEEGFPPQGLLRRALAQAKLADRARILADAYADEVRRSQGMGRIEIPAIGLDIVMVEGTDKASLQKGPGHYTLEGPGSLKERGDGSAFPGQGRTVGIAGHRTTYLAPFRRINEIERGDEVTLRMPYATFTYEITKHEIVDPDDVGIVEDVGRERLVLTACHPLYSAAQRYAQFAKLTEISLSAPGGGRRQDP